MRINFLGNTRINLLYFNDSHANVENQKHFYTASSSFDKRYKGQSNFKLCGGDLLMEPTLQANEFVLNVMKKIGLDACSGGNHDINGGNKLLTALENTDTKFKFLAANLKFTIDHKLKKHITSSVVIEKNNKKVGLIGLAPFDYHEVNNIDSSYNDFYNVQKFKKSIKSLKNEIKKLEKKGINKIVLLAHTGIESESSKNYYQELAMVGGLDIILGGHDHLEFDEWFNSVRNEPVRVLSAGKASDKNIKGVGLDSFGILNATFDGDGVLIKDKTKNKFHITKNYKADPEILEMEKHLLKNDSFITQIKKPLTTGLRVSEDLIGDLWADSVKWYVSKELGDNALDFALVNSGGIKCDLPKGNLKESILKQSLPYNPRIVVAKLTQEQIMNTLNWGAKSATFKKPEPGILQVSGLQYTICKDNKVKNVYILNKDGSIRERIDTAPKDKKYNVVYDEFLVSGPAGFVDLKKDKSEVIMLEKRTKEAIVEYLQVYKPDYSKGRILKEA